MNDHHIVGEREARRVRVFQMNETDAAKDPIFAFQQQIGAYALNKDDVQRVVLTDLGDMALSDFLIAAYDPDRGSFDSHKGALDALTGVVYVVRSAAFIDRPVTLNVTGGAKLIAAFFEQHTPASFKPLPDGGTQGAVEDPPSKKTPSDAAMGGRVATIALLVMAALVWVMIKIAG